MIILLMLVLMLTIPVSAEENHDDTIIHVKTQ
jgi:hypothetical protein